MHHKTFEESSIYWRGYILKGKYAHCCDDWDGLPIDETCLEWPCIHKEELINNGDSYAK